MISLFQFILLALALLLSLVAGLPLSIFPTVNVLDLLAGHNGVRAAHGASPLTWSDTLAGQAAQWASRCALEPTGGALSSIPYGENIAAGTGDFNTGAVMQLFTQDESEYNSSNPTYTHFTQVVWKATTEMGCAVAWCSTLFAPRFDETARLYVCLYDPPGNVIGQTLSNV